MAYNKTPFKMMGKSPMMKALVGKQGNLPMHLQEEIKASPVKQKAGYVKHKTLTVKGKPLEYNPKFDPKKLITDQSEARDRKSLKKKSPAKQVKQESSGIKDVMTGRSVRKKVRQESSGATDVMTGRKADIKTRKSPVKQVKVKDLPEKAVETGEKIIEGGKKLIKKIGNITLISKERQDCKKAGGKYSKKGGCFMPKSPAKKKGCSKKY